MNDQTFEVKDLKSMKTLWSKEPIDPISIEKKCKTNQITDFVSNLLPSHEVEDSNLNCSTHNLWD